MPVTVLPIVEGHGEVEAVPVLLKRIGSELVKGDWVVVMPPFRHPQGTLLKKDGLMNAVKAVRRKVGSLPSGGMSSLVLILIDAEDLCPREWGPRLMGWAKEARPDADIACVLPNPMFETWFAAAAASLAGVNGLPWNIEVPDDPEGRRLGKPWLKRQLSRKYSETVDQHQFAARMDLAQCRARSPSFDKLCRELERRLTASGG